MLNVQEKHFAICNNSWVMYLLISMSLPLLGFQTHPITSFAIRRPRGDLACASTCVVLFSTSCIKESSKWPGTNRRSLILGWSDSTFEQLWSNRIHLKKDNIGTTIPGRQENMHDIRETTNSPFCKTSIFKNYSATWNQVNLKSTVPSWGMAVPSRRQASFLHGAFEARLAGLSSSKGYCRTVNLFATLHSIYIYVYE